MWLIHVGTWRMYVDNEDMCWLKGEKAVPEFF